MVDAQAGVPAKRVPKIIPEGVDSLVRMESAERIRPALFEEAEIRSPRLRREQRIVEPPLRLLDVEIGWHDVEITCEHSRPTRAEQFGCVLNQPFEPA